MELRSTLYMATPQLDRAHSKRDKVGGILAPGNTPASPQYRPTLSEGISICTRPFEFSKEEPPSVNDNRELVTVFLARNFLTLHLRTSELYTYIITTVVVRKQTPVRDIPRLIV